MQYAQLGLLLKANVQAVGVDTLYDELNNVLKFVVQCASAEGLSVEVWRLNTGFQTTTLSSAAQLSSEPPTKEQNVREPTAALEYVRSSINRTLFVMVDLHEFLGAPGPKTTLRHTIEDLKRSTKRLVLLGSNLQNLSRDFPNQVHVLPVPALTPEQIEMTMATEVKSCRDAFRRAGLLFTTTQSTEVKKSLVKVSQGLTASQIQAGVRLSAHTFSGIDEQTLSIFQEFKNQRLKGCFLEPIEVPTTPVVGCDILMEFVNSLGYALQPAAQEYGIPQPRGIVLVGPPGTGKSHIAKSIASLWSIPGYRLSIASLFDSRIGETEKRMMSALRLVEAMAPCVLHIDEIDDAFNGVSGKQGDSGVSSRVFGEFLTWMSNKSAPVFVVATANSVENLPPALLRKGRFDEIFFVDEPNADERRSMFELHIARFQQEGEPTIDPALISELVGNSEGFSGADIQWVCERCAQKAYQRRCMSLPGHLMYSDFTEQIANLVPQSQKHPEQIRSLREWAQTAQRASSGN